VDILRAIIRATDENKHEQRNTPMIKMIKRNGFVTMPADIPITSPTLDNETQNAIIDYVLNERRNGKSEYIFVTAVGAIQKIARRYFRIKYRAQNTPSTETIPHDGLHIFRRTYASRLLQCGTPLPMISEMLGHINKNAVQCYLSTDDVKMKRCALGLSLIPWQRGDL
jgi:integrase/recombinase XerD